MAGIAIAITCALLSPLVVLKRMAFVGQGISHAAFGGVGVAVLIRSLVGDDGAFADGGVGQYLIVLAFCLLSAFMIGALTERRGTEADTAIGIVLVASMTLGAILLSVVKTRRGVAWESILFGSILEVRWSDAIIAWVVCAGLLATAWLARRNLLFWAFDEPAAPAFGVPAGRSKYLLVILLTLAIVTAMRLVGVVLATALLVLPGATALRLSDRLALVLVISAVLALGGLLAGLGISLKVGVLPPGAGIVASLVTIFAVVRGYELLRRPRFTDTPPRTAAGSR